MKSLRGVSYRTMGGYLGMSFMCVGGIILLPLLILPAYPAEAALSRFFIVPAVVTLVTGYLLSLTGHDRGLHLERQLDAVLVIVFWIGAVLLCSLPFMLSGLCTFPQAVFESTSGWSTTGLSVIDVTTAPKLILMYRSILLFFGGLGIVLVMSTILAGSGGMQLYHAEGHSDRLVPNLLESARVILLIYSGYILGGTLLYRIFGMDWFDAINHSIAAVSTGGFSTRAESIGYYHSASIEIITIILMILGNTGFLAHLLLLKGRVREFLNHDEFRFFLLLLCIAIPMVAFLLLDQFTALPSEALRVSIFQVVSALTTTGFQTIESFIPWSDSLLLILTALMLIGGGIGSTAGGIKQYRVYTLLRTIFWSIRDKLAYPATVFHDKTSRPGYNETVNYRAKTDVASFVFLYLLLYFLGVMLLTFMGVSLPDALFEFASALGTVGLSRGIMTLGSADSILWVGTFGMFIGRLEIYVFLTALYKIGFDSAVFLKRNRRRARYAGKKV